MAPSTGVLKIADGLALPVEAVTQTLAILAKRGVGKTHTAVVITEELLDAHQQVVILDPLDVWWGLRSSADGKGPGYPITVLGGEHADLPLEAGAGAVIADFVVENRAPVILSLRHFSMADQRRLVTDFCERLYHRKGQDQYRQPLHVVIDEADEFCPQRIPTGHERMFGAIDRIVRRGRASGLGVTLISQRAAVINKDVLTQIEVLVCLRTISPQDRKALEAWIEAHDAHDQRGDFMASLASLAIGEAWVWSPGWLDLFKRVKIRGRHTFDSSATPKVGQRAAAPQQVAQVDLEKLRQELAVTIERAKADDPRELRRRIAELEAELRKKATVIDPEALSRAKLLGIEEGKREVAIAFESIRAQISRPLARAERQFEQLDDAANEAAGIAATLRELQATTIETVAHARVGETSTLRAEPIPPSPVRKIAQAPTGAVGNSGLRRMLVALAQRAGLSARQLGLRAVLSSKSGTFKTYLGAGRSNGWITGTRDRLEITPAGRQALGAYDPLPEGPELLSYWLSELGNSGAARMLEVLAKAYPRALSAEVLGERAGISSVSGTFKTYLGKLRSLELVTGGRGALSASEELF